MVVSNVQKTRWLSCIPMSGHISHITGVCQHLSVGSGVDLLLLRSLCGWALTLTRASHGERWVMLHPVKLYFGCLSWHQLVLCSLRFHEPCTNPKLGASEGTHPLCPCLQTSAVCSCGLGRQSRSEFEHTWAQVASIPQENS